MNRWLLIRRLRVPAFLILFGFLALLNQWGVFSFRRSWPLYLILAGLVLLAERAALAGAFPPNASYPPSYTGPSAAAAGVPPSTDPGAHSAGATSAGSEDLPGGKWRP